MRASIVFLDTSLTRAALHLEPSRLERWFLGRAPQDIVITAVADLASGRIWIRETTGRRITSRKTLEAIDRAHVMAQAGLRIRSALRKS